MKTKVFQHLSSFGISGVVVPRKKIEALLSTQLQTDVLDEVLKDSKPEGPSLHELREPDLAKVNYTEKIRGGIQSLWQPLVEDPADVPPPQLLERLNHTWTAAEKRIGEEAQKDSRDIFRERAAGKAEIIRERAHREAIEKGIPAAIGWLQGLRQECARAAKTLGQEVLRFEKRKEKQKAAIEESKENWNDLLSKAAERSAEPHHVAWNFLIMAGVVLLAGLLLWLLSIPINSVLGVAGAVVAILVALKISWPLFRYLGSSRTRKLLSARLISSYKAMSLSSLDELTKRLELEYYSDNLPANIDKIIGAYQERRASLESKRESLNAGGKVLQASLHTASATVRTIVRESGLSEWYAQGKLQAPRDAWISVLCSVDAEPSWEEISEQAHISFEFLQRVKVEDEIFRLYKEKEERLGFLISLREAAIGRTPGEPLLSIDFSLVGERPMENHLILEISDPEHSTLAKEIQSAWGDAGVGLSIVPSGEASALSFIGIVYGFPFEAIKDYDSAFAAFTRAKEEEGRAIYPVLYPKAGEA